MEKFRYGKRPSSPSNNFTLNPIKKQKTVEIQLDTEDDVKQTQMKKTIRGICNKTPIKEEDLEPISLYKLDQKPLQAIDEMNNKYFNQERIEKEVKERLVLVTHEEILAKIKQIRKNDKCNAKLNNEQYLSPKKITKFEVERAKHQIKKAIQEQAKYRLESEFLADYKDYADFIHSK